MSETEESRNILITGATGGLGHALALECARRGARVILLDRKAKPLEAVCDEVEALGAPAPGYVDLDLAQAGPEAIEELVSGLVDAYGGLDGLVHCAVRFDGLRPVDQIAPQDWILDLQVNLNAPWLLTTRCLPTLRERHGRIVFFTDREARGKAYWGSYGASKGALESLAGSLAEELEGSGCEVVVLDPGAMRTELRSAAYLGEDPSTVPPASEAAAPIADRILQPPTDD